jgi:hypothetical protein
MIKLIKASIFTKDRFLTKRAFSTGLNQSILNELLYTVKFDELNRIVNLPQTTDLDPSLDHAPKRQHTLNGE